MRSVNAHVGCATPWATVGECLADEGGGGERQVTANACSGDAPIAARSVTLPPTTKVHAAAAADAGGGDAPAAALSVPVPLRRTDSAGAASNAGAGGAANASGGDAPTAARSAANVPTRPTPAEGTRPQQADYHSIVITNPEQEVHSCQSNPSVTSFPTTSTFFLLLSCG